MMRQLRRVLKGGVGLFGWPLAGRLAARQLGGEVGLILMFHYINAPLLPGVTDDLYITPGNFDAILGFYTTHFTVLPPHDFLDAQAAGNLPPRAVMLTFDDGLRDNVVNALPLLRKHGVKAAFFVCPGLIDAGRSVGNIELSFACKAAAPGGYAFTFGDHRFDFTLSNLASRQAAYQTLHTTLLGLNSRHHGDYLQAVRAAFGVTAPLPELYQLASYAELRQLTQAGMTVSNHTLHHAIVGADGPQQFADGVQAAAQRLTEELPAADHRIFCYPLGRQQEVTPQTTAALSALGYSYGLMVQGGLADTRQRPLLELYRAQVSYSAAAARAVPLIATLRHRRR